MSERCERLSGGANGPSILRVGFRQSFYPPCGVLTDSWLRFGHYRVEEVQIAALDDVVGHILRSPRDGGGAGGVQLVKEVHRQQQIPLDARKRFEDSPHLRTMVQSSLILRRMESTLSHELGGE